jgi:hypothetical protein
MFNDNDYGETSNQIQRLHQEDFNELEESNTDQDKLNLEQMCYQSLDSIETITIILSLVLITCL